MKYGHVLCLLTSALFLIACEPIKECSWSKDIRFDPATKSWLGGIEWPDTAYADFNKIGDHNELFEQFCN